MQVIIGTNVAVAGIAYGFSSLGDLLGLEIKVVSTISDAEKAPVIIYYGKHVPWEVYGAADVVLQICPDQAGLPNAETGTSKWKALVGSCGRNGCENGKVLDGLNLGVMMSSYCTWRDERTLVSIVDFAAALQFMLRLEHEEGEKADIFGRPIGADCWLKRDGLSDYPVVDILCELFWLACCVAHGRSNSILAKKCRWPKGRRYCVVISHDVDVVHKWTLAAALRESRQLVDLVNAAKRPQAWRAVRAMARGMLFPTTDPYWNLDQIALLEKQYGVESTFYFLARRRHKRINGRKIVGNYGRMQREIRKIMGELVQGGAEIGLHGSIEASCSGRLLKSEREEIERWSGGRCSGVRQHFLCFDRHKTPLAQENGGLLHDSTIGYRDICGYRCGTGYPFLAFNYESNCQGKLLELPLVIMDSALMIESKGQRDLARSKALDFLARARDFESAVPILWHNTSCVHATPAWLGELFQEILSCSFNQETWVTNSARVCDWWHQRRDCSIRIIDTGSQAKTIAIEKGSAGRQMGADIFVPTGVEGVLRGFESVECQTGTSSFVDSDKSLGGSLRRISF